MHPRNVYDADEVTGPIMVPSAEMLSAPPPRASAPMKKMSGLTSALLIIGAGVVTLGLGLGAIALLSSDGTKSSTASTAAAGPSEPLEAPASEQPQPEVAPPAPERSYVPVGRPASLTVYSGQDVILSTDVIKPYWAEEMELIHPPDEHPIWLASDGTGVGTDMGTAWFFGHNYYRDTIDPFGELERIQIGDTAEVTLESGEKLSFRFDDLPGGDAKGQSLALTNDPGLIKLVSCINGGEEFVVYTGKLIK
jgi:hypothetical protein